LGFAIPRKLIFGFAIRYPGIYFLRIALHHLALFMLIMFRGLQIPCISNIGIANSDGRSGPLGFAIPRKLI